MNKKDKFSILLTFTKNTRYGKFIENESKETDMSPTAYIRMIIINSIDEKLNLKNSSIGSNAIDEKVKFILSSMAEEEEEEEEKKEDISTNMSILEF